MKKQNNLALFFGLVFTLLFTISNGAPAYASSFSIMAEDYAVNEDGLQQLSEDGWNHQDLNRAGFLALASGETLDTVAKYKAISGSWEGTESLLGLTDWHIAEAQQNLIANQLHQVCGVDKLTVKNVLNQKYHPKAAAIGAAISQSSSVEFEIVMSKKNYDTSWYDVGAQVGLTAAEVDQSLLQLNEAFQSRLQFGDAYGFYGGVYGYKDSDYHTGGYDIDDFTV